MPEKKSKINWDGTPIEKLPTRKIKNIIQSEFAFDNTKNYKKFAQKSLNNKKEYFGTRGIEMRQALQSELFKRKLWHNEKLKQDKEKSLESRIDKFFSILEKAVSE